MIELEKHSQGRVDLFVILQRSCIKPKNIIASRNPIISKTDTRASETTLFSGYRILTKKRIKDIQEKYIMSLIDFGMNAVNNGRVSWGKYLSLRKLEIEVSNLRSSFNNFSIISLKNFNTVFSVADINAYLYKSLTTLIYF